jgi:hypothetical protein
MAKRTNQQVKEANALISENNFRSKSKGLETPHWNAVLWRYLDLPKFVSMLSCRSLPMCRIDKFEDKWEGFSAPLSNNEYKGFFAEKDKKSDLERFEKGEQLRKFYYASCWHMNASESDAMWKLYISCNEGVAIRTTYQSLIYSLKEVSEDFLIGLVRYKKPSPGLSMLLTCMTKREPFAHEKEVRVIWHNANSEESYRKDTIDSPYDFNKLPLVIQFRCDLCQLIEEVAISPKAGEWFTSAISDLLKKYELKDVRVEKSALYGEPPWPKRNTHV